MTSVSASLHSRSALGLLDTRRDHSPNYQEDDRANDCVNEARAFAGFITTNGLAKIRCDEPEDGPQYKALPG